MFIRRENVLRVWKRKQGCEATYRSLLKCVDHETVKKICALKLFQDPTIYFPYLLRGTMSEEQFSMLKARLDEETEKIKFEFASLMFDLQKDLEKTLPLEDLVSFLAFNNTKYKSLLKNCDSYSEVFLTLKKIVNFFDYDPLEDLIYNLGSNTIKEKLERYRGYFKEYSERLIEYPVGVFGECKLSKKKVVLVVGKHFETLTFDDLKKFKHRVDKIMGNQIVLCVRRGSGLSFDFKKQQQAFQGEGVNQQPVPGINSL